jgi:O-antigen/teichoic acid export membrane protein
VLLAHPLLTLWRGADHGTLASGVLRLLATAAFFNSLALVPFVMLEGTGRPDLVAKYHLIELPFYALLLWFAVGRFGIAGAAAAWLVRVSIMTPLLFALAARVAGAGFGVRVRRRALPAVVAGVVALLLAHVWSLSLDGTRALWIGLAVPLLHALLSWRWLLDIGERSTLGRVMRHLTPTRTDTAGNV